MAQRGFGVAAVTGKTTYTRSTPFYDSKLAPGEFLVAFVLYADTHLILTAESF